MSSPTDTNQASEDELRGRIIAIFADSIGDLVDDTDDVLAIIRTEKLKLLAEVRERVVGEDDETIKTPLATKRLQIIDRNMLRLEQRDILTKLEAEL